MKRYCVGIDLGTTNTVLAYAELDARTEKTAARPAIQLFDILQLVAPGELKALPMLASARYHPARGELAAGELQLPWQQPTETTTSDSPEALVIGQLARKLGAQVPGQLVTSAKSWLSHAGVDRMAPILPWGAAPGVAKVSPMAACASYLAHLRAGWNQRFPEHPLEQQELVLTLPASFDEGARALTLAAATLAGLPELRLLEEPQAVFYNWLFQHETTLAQDLQKTRLVLVCDVGGGTTDLSLIKVEPAAASQDMPKLTRIAVGNHLMLGGDNMDLALAHLAEARLTEIHGNAANPSARLSAAGVSQLIERVRAAKETLLAANAPQAASVTMLGAGAGLIKAARTIALTRAEVEQIVVDGFFPLIESSAEIQRGRSGLVEFGLPYASDPAITRHIASFLRQHAALIREALGADADAVESSAFPDTLLLNGGVFRADALVQRLQATLASWRGAPLQLLENAQPDLAVARGAVAYALAGHSPGSSLGPRIGGGAARSYFLLLDAEPAARRAICILPRGSIEGHEILLAGRTFALRVGQPVRFHLLSSVAPAKGQAAPRAGDLVDVSEGNFVSLPPIALVLAADSGSRRKDIKVQLATRLTELGMLEMHCVAEPADDQHPGQRWLLEFQLRGSSQAGDAKLELAPRHQEALDKIERIFGPRAQQVSTQEVKQIRLHLEQVLGSRERWPTPLLRQLFDTLLLNARGRRRSAGHERAWLNLAGYCLRPGFGHPLDDWRIEQVWPLFEAGVQHRQDGAVCTQWWTLWRRVAGGLAAEQQLRLLQDFAFNLQTDAAEAGPRPATLVKGSFEDMLRLGAALERIPSEHKVEIGAWLLAEIVKPEVAQQLKSTSRTAHKDALAQRSKDLHLRLWALGRIGARQPLHGNAHDVAPAAIVAGWFDALFALDWKKVEAAAFAAAHIARMSGDRARDLEPALREHIVQRLKACAAPAAWVAMVSAVVQLDEADERRLLGEALPPGLKLIV